MRLITTAPTGFSLVVLALSAPAAISHLTTDPITAWENTQTKKYHCEGKSVVSCETSTGGTCFAVDSCEAYCFSHENGASCVDMGEPVVTISKTIDVLTPKAPTSASGVNIAARDASPQENKHFTCSKDRTGVLICKYGFCSTDHYCKSYDECKSDCNCCKSRFSLTQDPKSEIRALPVQIEDKATRMVTRGLGMGNKSHVCSEDRVSILKCEYGFCATEYVCAERHLCADSPAHCKKAFNAQD